MLLELVLIIIILLIIVYMYSKLTSGKSIPETVGKIIPDTVSGIIQGTAELINPKHHTVPENGKCSQNDDCIDFAIGSAGLGCDNGICKPMLKDYAGIYWNASECKDAPGRPGGTCSRGYSWPRLLGEECILHSDCKGHMPGQNTLACENSKCVQQVKNWMGVYYIPSECQSSIFAKPGTCNSTEHWPRLEGESCSLNTDCSGHKPAQSSLGCNNGKCEQMKKDWFGVWYNASECRGGAFSGPGTCS